MRDIHGREIRDGHIVVSDAEEYGVYCETLTGTLVASQRHTGVVRELNVLPRPVITGRYRRKADAVKRADLIRILLEMLKCDELSAHERALLTIAHDNVINGSGISSRIRGILVGYGHDCCGEIV